MKVAGIWPENDAFIEKQSYGSKDSRVNIDKDVRSGLSWVTSLFGSSNTLSAKLINYEVVQVANGYHDIFKELFVVENGTSTLPVHCRCAYTLH